MISFSKYHGCGNSFVIITEEEAGEMDRSLLAESMCSESLGIGADGLIIVRTVPELEMIFYNRDGSRAPMCGNGIRCFARYCLDEGLRTENAFPVQTLAGVMKVNVISREPFLAEIDMGRPDFDPAACGMDEKEPFINRKLELADTSVEVSTFFMGTVHTVLWVDEPDSFDYEGLGRQICHHLAYPEQTNVNMATVKDEHTLEAMTYERGVGMTFACGTGACATVVAGIMAGKCGKETDVKLPFGTLHITEKEDGEIFMRGPAEFIARGSFGGGKK